MDEVSFREDFVEEGLLSEVILSISESPFFLEVLSAEPSLRILKMMLSKSAQRLVANVILQKVLQQENLNEVLNKYSKIILFCLKNIGTAEFNQFAETILEEERKLNWTKDFQISLRGLFALNNTPD